MVENMDELLKTAIEREISDLHIKAGNPPGLRIRGELLAMEGVSPLTADDTRQLITSIMPDEKKEVFEESGDVDFAYSFSDLHRFRVNVYMQRDSMAAVLRAIPINVPTLDDLGLPEILKEIAIRQRGLVLVTGPTGSGKSSTLAAMIDYINSRRKCNIVTMEDPIEFIHIDNMSYVSQREIGRDTKSFNTALTHVLRQDPDVILVGEMRDYETIEIALTAAETGHLVMATLHTNSASETVNRVINAFPSDQQSQIRVQLSVALEAVICQVLVPSRDEMGRVCAIEIMTRTSAVGNLIRENKAYQLDNVIQTNSSLGMRTLDQALNSLVERDLITFEVALAYALNPEDLKRMARGITEPSDIAAD